MKEIIKCEADCYPSLLGIWERSVRATHAFLTEDDIAEIGEALIPSYFPAVELFGLNLDGVLTGFIGLSDDKIEMLFVDAVFRHRGYGSALIEYAKAKGIGLVDVNEQNPDALVFYKRHGFRVIGPDDTDESGRPFAILHLSL